MDIKAAPDTLIVELLDDNSEISYGENNNGRLLKGKILNIGPLLQNNAGNYEDIPYRKNQIVFFLSYEGDYDNRLIDNLRIYFVLLKDVRGYAAQ